MTPAPFERIAIVGLGLIGGSIALAARQRWPDVRVLAVDRAAVVDAALEMRAIDAGSDRLELAAEAQLIVLAAPVLQNVSALRALPAHVPGPALVTDAGSTKRVMADAARTLPDRLPFVGGHPLSGAAVSGLEAARPDLFADRPWILTGSAAAPAGGVDALKQFITGIRAVPHEMDADEHDRLLAYISHLPQLAVSALMHVVGGQAGEQGLALAGRGLRDTTRLASSPAPTWRDIVASNGDHIAAALDDLIAALQALRPEPGAAPATLDDTFRSAAKWKGVLEHS